MVVSVRAGEVAALTALGRAGKSRGRRDTHSHVTKVIGQRQERERTGVLDWRRDQLLRSGFSARLAARLAADSRHDLHALIELVERGCSPELAARILAPLEEDAAP